MFILLIYRKTSSVQYVSRSNAHNEVAQISHVSKLKKTSNPQTETK